MKWNNSDYGSLETTISLLEMEILLFMISFFLVLLLFLIPHFFLTLRMDNLFFGEIQ